MSAVIIARGLSYEFPNGRQLFTHLNFTLEDTVTALVGRNAAGKSTLATVLCGQLPPTRGVVTTQGSVDILKQRELPPPVTVEDYLADNNYEWSRQGNRLLEDIDRQAVCPALSGGQWMRVRLACTLRSQFVILDEPTNDLDADGRQAVLDFLRHHQSGVLLISHDRACLQLCREVLELSNRGLTRYGAGWNAYVEAKEHERERLRTALDIAKRQRDAALAQRTELRARQERRNRRGADSASRGGTPRILLGARKRGAQVSSGKLDAATLARAEKHVRGVHEVFAEMKIDPVMYADLMGDGIPAQKLVAEAEGFNVRFGEWIYPSDLNFTWRGNLRIALTGSNGSGKSTLLKALLGEPSFETRGQLRRGDLATLYVDQQCSLLDDELTVLENVRAISRRSDTEIRNELAKFLFAGEAVFQPVGALSGGERLRAALARGFLGTEHPELLILDEPTNSLDLANLSFLEGLLSQFPGALIVVSHDDTFLHNCGCESQSLWPPSAQGSSPRARSRQATTPMRWR
jgi:ATPase subunit of ABC transporter with duplicated ATPase domains